MKLLVTFGIIFVILLVLELIYFRLAARFNIIDKPNERSSHSSVVLRGGGVIFLFGLWIWSVFFGFHYPWLLCGVTIAAGISFIDDVRSLPDSVRLVAQFVAMGLLLVEIYFCARNFGLFADSNLLVMAVLTLVALIVCVGATNIYNFMDGINGITAVYSLAVLIPLFLLNKSECFVSESLVIVTILSTLVFGLFNFRPKGKAKCFAGDVGSIGIAYILLFLIGGLIVRTQDVTYLIFLIVYGVDGVLTICHRIMLHENLGEAHRKHAYQLMANELKIGHMQVSSFYALLQLAVSIGFIFLCPDTVLSHWIYLAATCALLSIAYLLFMKKYFYLHEEYLETLKK